MIEITHFLGFGLSRRGALRGGSNGVALSHGPLFPKETVRLELGDFPFVVAKNEKLWGDSTGVRSWKMKRFVKTQLIKGLPLYRLDYPHTEVSQIKGFCHQGIKINLFKRSGVEEWRYDLKSMVRYLHGGARKFLDLPLIERGHFQFQIGDRDLTVSFGRYGPSQNGSQAHLLQFSRRRKFRIFSVPPVSKDELARIALTLAKDPRGTYDYLQRTGIYVASELGMKRKPGSRSATFTGFHMMSNYNKIIAWNGMLDTQDSTDDILRHEAGGHGKFQELTDKIRDPVDKKLLFGSGELILDRNARKPDLTSDVLVDMTLEYDYDYTRPADRRHEEGALTFAAVVDDLEALQMETGRSFLRMTSKRVKEIEKIIERRYQSRKARLKYLAVVHYLHEANPANAWRVSRCVSTAT